MSALLATGAAGKKPTAATRIASPDMPIPTMMLCKAMPWARFVMVSTSTGRRAWRLSVALDKTVDVVATAAAALFAVDVEHIELADNVAEWIAAFRLASRSPICLLLT